MDESTKQMSFLNIKGGKTPREDLFILFNYPAVDPLLDGNWASVLGEKTFVCWLKLLTLVDRSDQAESKYGNMQTVPRSLEGLAKLLGMSKPTLYKQVIKPLWNYGLIDLEEWSDQKKIGTKAINIIVYNYPQHNPDLKNKPLQKVRDYDKDYKSLAKTYAKMAGELLRSEKEHVADLEPAPLTFEEISLNNKDTHKIILKYLYSLKIKLNIIQDLAEQLKAFEMYDFSLEEVEYQLKYMKNLVDSGTPIYEFATYFINGLVKRRESDTSLRESAENIPVALEQSMPSQDFLFYDWLEERE